MGKMLACTALVRDGLPFRGRGAGLEVGKEVGAELVQFGFLALYIAGIWLFGFFLATAVCLLGILLGLARMRPLGAAVYGALLLVAAYELAILMNMRLPRRSAVLRNRFMSRLTDYDWSFWLRNLPEREKATKASAINSATKNTSRYLLTRL